MKNTGFYTALIHGIEQLYYRVSMILWRKRMDGYHEQASQGYKSYANGIKSPLLDCIDNIVVNSPVDSKVLHNNDSPVPDATTNLKTPAKKHTDKPRVVDQGNIGDTSGYYKARANGSDLYPEIVKKLEHSIWEHIHATIRYARQGDKGNARMHTDIANSACKELAHHMTEEDYQAFIMQIDAHLNSVKQH